MRRLAGMMIFGPMFLLAVRAEIDPIALLSKARAKIVENITKFPKYTCVQTVRRSRFDAIPAVRVGNCGYVQDPRIEPRLRLAWIDRYKLDVTVSAGAEIFSWVGAQRFQSEDVDQIVGGGMTGTGDFGPFLITIFSSNGVEYEYLGPEQDKGRVLAAYRYRVPLAVSHYQVKVGPSQPDAATVAYEGKFWIDPENAELRRMTIEVSDPPGQAKMCRAETAIDYGRARIGGFDFLLPQVTILKLWYVEAERSENRIDYAGCREFQAESVLRTGPEPSASESAAPQTPPAIPAGLTIKIALRSKIDSESSFAGDPIEGELLNAIRDQKERLLAPAGAIAHGRIVRFEHQYQPSNYFAVGLKFDSIDVNGSEVPMTLVALPHSTDNILAVHLETRPGVGTFVFHSDRLTLDHKFITEWKTADAKQFE